MDNENYEEIKAKNFRFGQVGDYIKGTLIKVSKTTTPDQWGKLSHVYTVIAKEGTFLGSHKDEKKGKNVDDEKPTTINNGEEYTFFVSNDKGVVIGKMGDLKIGQNFMAKFVESKPTQKGNDAKIITVFAGKNADGTPSMNQAYLDSLKDDAAGYEQM